VPMMVRNRAVFSSSMRSRTGATKPGRRPRWARYCGMKHRAIPWCDSLEFARHPYIQTNCIENRFNDLRHWLGVSRDGGLPKSWQDAYDEPSMVCLPILSKRVTNFDQGACLWILALAAIVEKRVNYNWAAPGEALQYYLDLIDCP
jgi:hypothetical protein